MTDVRDVDPRGTSGPHGHAVARPAGPGVVVIHDVAGMSQGLKNRARWRGERGVPGDHPWGGTP
jgi:dienelactone hydrolase